MSKLFFVLLFAGLTFAEDVVELTDSTFQSEVEGKDIILVEFFAPWCGHCKRLAPEYEKAATALKNNDPPVTLAKVDCTEAGKESCSKYGVSGYPTLKIFRDGTPSEYDGPRQADGIINYMRKQSGPASVELKDIAHFEKKLQTAEDNIVVGFFSGETNLGKNFLKAAAQNREDYVFAHTNDAALCAEAAHTDSVVMFRPKHLHAKFEPTEYVLDDASSDTSAIVSFLKSKAVGLVGQVNPTNGAKFNTPLITAYYNVDWKRNAKGSKYWRNRVARVAKKLPAVNFAIASKSDFSREMGDWGFDLDKDEVHVVGKNEKGQVFLMEDSFSVENLEKFANAFNDGQLKPYIKSESVPESNDGPVKVVVGETFEELVNDPTKDVLIEFYAPWCGHCKSLEPKYNELGEKLKHVKDIVIAKMDSTANDSPPEYQVSGFPTIYFKPMGTNPKPKKYEGGREVNDFIDYLKREATNSFDLDGGEGKKKKKKKSKKSDEL